MTKLREKLIRWAVALIRADHLYWNWYFERVPLFVNVWFNWINWVLILAALQFVATKYHSKVALVVLWFSYMLLLNYFHALYITHIEKPKENAISRVKTHSMASWLVAFAGAIGVIFLVRALVSAVVSGME
jgi:hypothetical protein